jgi:hypothetical protein
MKHDEQHWLEEGADSTEKQPLIEHPRMTPEGKLKRPMCIGSSASIGNIEDAGIVVSDKFDAPTSAQLVGTQIVMTLGYMGYMMSSWLETTLRHKEAFPICTDHWASWWPLMSSFCISSILIYWTFPLCCCLVLLMYTYRDLLLTRMYYVMFVHQVHIDIRNIHFFHAVSVRIMLGWCVLCVLVYPLTGTIGVNGILQTLTFWVPVMSFGAMLYSQWDLEKRLLSVAKLVENDVQWAGNHVKDSFFLRDYIAEKAFRQVEQVLAKQKPAPELSTGDYILQIAAEAEKIQNVTNPGQLYALKRSLRKEASITLFHAMSSRYWVCEFLYSPHLVDARAQNFKTCFRYYYWFTFVSMLLLAFLCLSTILTVLIMQKMIDIPPSLDFNWINWIATSINEHKGRIPIIQGETQAFKAEISALQQENAALLSEVASLKAMLALSP